MSTIKPTIGRKVWFWTDDLDNNVAIDKLQAFDASIVFVHPDGKVNLTYWDHHGLPGTASSVELSDPESCDRHGVIRIATWMPFQVGQAKAAATT